MPRVKGFPDNERTIIDDEPLIPSQVPEPPQAALSTGWFESEDVGLNRYTDEPTVQRAKTIVELSKKAATTARDTLTTKDPFRTEAQHLEDWDKRTGKNAKALSEEIVKFDDQLADELRGIEGEITERLSLQETGRATEIRNYVRSLSAEERSEFIAGAVERGDSETVAALIKGPAYLSGMSEDAKASLAERFKRTHAGDLVARREALEKASEIASNAVNSTEGYLKEIYPAKSFAKIRERQDKARNAWGNPGGLET